MKKKNVIINAVIFIGVILFDQISKWAIDCNMNFGDSFDVIPGFFKITYLRNTGGAWSLFENNSMIFFYILTIVAIIAMIYFYKTTESHDKLTKIGLVFMMAGTFGNFIDRIMFQHVRDFLDFLILGYDFPVFNVADIALCFGVFLIFVTVVLEYFGGVVHAKNK